MVVYVELSPFLRKYLPGYDSQTGLVMQTVPGKTIYELMEELGIPKDRVNSVIVNYFPSDISYVVKDGDKIGLIMAIGGG